METNAAEAGRTGSPASPFIRALPAVLCLVAVSCAGIAVLAAAFPQRGSGTVFFATDAMCIPSRLVRIEARIYGPRRTSGPNPGIPGVRVSISRNGTVFQHAVTDKDGNALFIVEAPDRPGHYAYLLSTSGDFGQGTAEAVVHVLKPNEEFAVLDAAVLMQGGEAAFLASGGGNRPAPAAGAAASVMRIAGRRGLIYLTCMNERCIPAFRRWLSSNGFPPGLVVARDDTLALEPVRDFVKKRVEELKYYWHTSWIAICAGPAFAQGCAALRVRGFVVQDRSATDLPEGFQASTSIEEAAEAVGRKP